MSDANLPQSEGELVHLERRADGVAVLTLDRPPANALSVGLLIRLTELAEQLLRDPPGAVVLAGNQKFFAAGAEISEFGSAEVARDISGRFRAATDALVAIPRTTIAAVDGFALGGGCELAIACDLRVAGTRARFGQPEILLGIIPGGGGTQRLARLIGVSRAKDMVLTGRQVGADEALRIGLVDRVAPEGTGGIEAALELAAQLAKGPLQAHAATKRAVDEGLDGSLAAGLDLETRLFSELFNTEDARVGIESFLRQGPGKATFSGR
jgi:enoyl-CoA hydratase